MAAVHSNWSLLPEQHAAKYRQHDQDGRQCLDRRQCSGSLQSIFGLNFHGHDEPGNEYSEDFTSRELLVEEDRESPSEAVKSVEELSSRSLAFQSTSKVNKKGQIEEKWEFEVDAYALGLCALVQRGLARAWPEVLIAVTTPVLQLVAFFSLMIYLVNQPHSEIKPALLGPIALCLFLMSASFVRESVEACKKISFSCRCLNNMYKLPYSPQSLVFGIILGFFQISMAVGAFALTCILLFSCQNVLEVFMNFLAVSFITEIDNTLMEIKMVKYRASAVEFTFLVERKKEDDDSLDASPDEQPKTHLSTTLFVIFNVLAFANDGLAMQVNVLSIAAGQGSGGQEVNWWFAWGVLLVVLAACNVVLFIGERCVGAWYVCLFILLAFACGFWANLVHRYLNDGAYLYLYSPLLGMQYFASTCFWMPIATAAEADALQYLLCPIRLPLLFWLLGLSTPFWIHQLMRFGNA